MDLLQSSIFTAIVCFHTGNISNSCLYEMKHIYHNYVGTRVDIYENNNISPQKGVVCETVVLQSATYRGDLQPVVKFIVETYINIIQEKITSFNHLSHLQLVYLAYLPFSLDKKVWNCLAFHSGIILFL